MKRFTPVLAAILLLASNVAPAASRDDSNNYVATIDPPTGSKNCGFSLSGTIKSPKPDYLSYGFFYRSELNIATALDRHHDLRYNHFSGPGTLRVTGESKELGDESIFQKHKFVQAQLRVWRTNDPGLIYIHAGETPQVTPLSESIWVDIPATSPGGCVGSRMMLSPMPGNSPTPPNPATPAPNTAPKRINLQTIPRAP